MGTKVQSKTYFPGVYSMRDLEEDSNCCSWPLYYQDKTVTNGQSYNNFFPRAIADAYPPYDKDGLKRTMLEHEAIFQNQVSELHRLYRIQRDLMEEVKYKELHENRIPIEPSSSSSLIASQITTAVAQKWHIPNFPVANSVCGRPSIFGAEDAHSPLCSMKGSRIQAGKNGVNSKDVEVLECRSTKVRRKMFDLHLPADQYIDIEEAEQFKDDTASGMSSYLPNGNGKIEPESVGKKFHNDVEKTGCQVETSRSDACLRGKISLADLNEPVKIEKTNGSPYSHFVAHDPCHGVRDQSAKPEPKVLGFPKDISVNSHYESENRSINNVHVENSENTRRCFSHVLEAGQSKINSKFISPSFQPQKLPVTFQQVQVPFDKGNDPPAFSLTEQSKADVSRERMLHRKISSNSYPESKMASNVPSFSPFDSSDPINPWSHSVSSLQKPSSSLSQKSMSFQTNSFFNSPPSNGNFGEKWPASSNSRLNPGFGRELPNQNNCHYGSSSGSKELALHFLSTSYDYVNGGNVDKGVFEQFSAYGSTKPYYCSNVVSNRSSNEPVSQRGPQTSGERKNKDHLPTLPWLRAKPAYKNEAISAGRDLDVRELSFSQSSPKKSMIKNETGNGFNQIFIQNVESVSSSNNADASRSERSECLRDKKILGVPIFEKHYGSKKESSFTSPYVSASQPSEGEAEDKGKNRLFDINLPYDASVLDPSQDIVAENSAIGKEADTKLSSFRHQIDLNSCADEDEASFIPNVPSNCMRMIGGIDLEAPLVPEPEDAIHQEELSEKAHKLPLESAQSRDDCLQDELMKSAAEAMVAISSSGLCSHLHDVDCNLSETSVTDPLNWFVETISSFGEDLESKFEAILRDKDGAQDDIEEIDYFESMILKLAETKEDDYMPKPLVPENFKVEETGTTSLLTTRTRKGQGRRGRQRRDFQRDILPGLASLSRLEVTQDLQTFGGLMKATGHSWHSGLTRRNSNRGGCGSGRRRLVTSSSPALEAATTLTPLMPQLNHVELGLEDRSLTGWGKTTRRPRRQRCPAGNLPSLALA